MNCGSLQWQTFQFEIFSPWKALWNWIAFYWSSFVISLENERRQWRPSKRGLLFKSCCFFETITKKQQLSGLKLQTDLDNQGKGVDIGSPENSSENKDSNLKNKQDLSPLSEVKNLRLKNVNKIIVGQIATCARNPKVPGSSPAASYVQRWALCSNRLANV